MNARRTLRRVHLWLAWIAGVPILFWMVSGLWMVARPIEEVRGGALRTPAAALVLPTTITPPSGAKTLALEMQTGRPVWITTLADGRSLRADPATGRPLSGPDRVEAMALARAARVAPPPPSRPSPAPPPTRLHSISAARAPHGR